MTGLERASTRLGVLRKSHRSTGYALRLRLKPTLLRKGSSSGASDRKERRHVCTSDAQRQHPVDKVGTIYGDLWSEVRNRHSRRLYLILTLPDLGSDDWVTHLFALVETKVLFGLLTFTAMDFNRPLVTFRRRNREKAAQLHAQLRGIVTQEEEDAWCAFLPAPTPPEGDTEAAQPRGSTPGRTDTLLRSE
jgi:hypothetical protein